MDLLNAWSPSYHQPYHLQMLTIFIHPLLILPPMLLTNLHPLAHLHLTHPLPHQLTNHNLSHFPSPFTPFLRLPFLRIRQSCRQHVCFWILVRSFHPPSLWPFESSTLFASPLTSLLLFAQLRIIAFIWVHSFCRHFILAKLELVRQLLAPLQPLSSSSFHPLLHTPLNLPVLLPFWPCL